MKNLSLLFAFAGGALAGAIVGVMLAPDKGENIRKKLCCMAHSKAHNMKNKVKEYLEEHGIELDCDQIDELVKELIEKDTPAQS